MEFFAAGHGATTRRRLVIAPGLIVVMAMSGCGRACGPGAQDGVASAPGAGPASTPPAAAGQAASPQASGTAPITISQRGPGGKGATDAALQLPVPRTFELTHVASAHYASALGKDPQRVFEFVRDHIAYEAYSGCLRGARGTLLAMAGNSVDRAALLADLLEKSGHKVRFARGKLSEVKARELVGSMWSDRRPQLQEETQLAPGVVADRPADREDPGSDRYRAASSRDRIRAGAPASHTHGPATPRLSLVALWSLDVYGRWPVCMVLRYGTN